MKRYDVDYKMYQADEIKTLSVFANNKEEAYDKATFGAIPQKNDGAIPYSAWVASVEYASGRAHFFNTFEGMPY